MVAADRQQIIETNRSLRNIKNELENLLEKGVIDDALYESIHNMLPAEGSLHGAPNRAVTPASSSAASPAPPTAALSNLNLQQQQQQQQPQGQPPSYAQTGPPSLPSRAQPPPPPPSKPVLTHARAMYRYAGADARDCTFERDDRIAVHEYMNADWWMGRNLRTGQEGIFPRNYVEPEPIPAQMTPAVQPNGYYNEKAGYNNNPYQQQQQQQQNPYNSHVPPMAVASQPTADVHQQQDQQQQQGGEGAGGKAGEMGKKFGKKLGNAAIFGAGATLGGNLVNSIF